MEDKFEFRPMRRKGQQLDDAECERILKEGYRGILAVNGEGGYPYALPIDYVYEDGHIYCHCAKEGHKLDALKACDKACFTVIDKPVQEPGSWWFHVKSVICFGRVRIIEEGEEKLLRLRQFGGKYYPTQEELEKEIAHAATRADVLDITIEHMTGKRIKEN